MKISSAIQSDFNCEYLIIGSGAGGSVAAFELSKAGKDVVIIEEGPHVPTEQFNSSIAMSTYQLYRQGGVSPIWGKPVIGFAEGQCVGGSTVINAGYFSRPSELLLNQWDKNLGYQGYKSSELERHFIKIEKHLKVSTHPQDNFNRDSDIIKDACQKIGWLSVNPPRVIEDCKNSNLCPTGCPIGAKQSMLVSYLPKALSYGTRLYSSTRALSIKSTKDKVVVSVVSKFPKMKKYKIQAKKVILACGAIQTPQLLLRSRLSKNAGQQLRIHTNLKIVARFREPVFAEKGTVCTSMVREFQSEGMLISPANFRLPYVLSTLAHFDNSILSKVICNSEYYGLFITQLRSKVSANVKNFLGKAIIQHNGIHDDWQDIIKALRRTTKLLFAAGAVEVLLPIKGTPVVKSFKDLEKIIFRLKLQNIELITVHAMASCSIGKVLDSNGKLKGHPRILVCDASALPTNIGESPQATIMAFAHEFIERELIN